MHGKQSYQPSQYLIASSVTSEMSTHWIHCSGILVPGGFGVRGTEGMMLAIKWAREQKIPFLGICFGFQLAVVEWARNVCGLTGTSLTIKRHLLHCAYDDLHTRRNIRRIPPGRRASDHHLHA